MKSLIAVLLFVGVTFGALSPAFGYRDLETGTFITRDPAGFVDGPNLYTYVRQNPWTFFDPHGLFNPYQAAQYNSSEITGGTYDPHRSTKAFARHVSNSPVLQSEGRRAVKFVLAVDMAVLTASSFSAFIGEVFEKLTGLPAPNEQEPEESRPEGETARDTQEDKDDPNAPWSTETEERSKPGADGGKSEMIKKKDNTGRTSSTTHRVTRDGEVIHQHEDHKGKAGGSRQFPPEWTGTENIDHEPGSKDKPAPDNSITDEEEG